MQIRAGTKEIVFSAMDQETYLVSIRQDQVATESESIPDFVFTAIKAVCEYNIGSVSLDDCPLQNALDLLLYNSSFSPPILSGLNSAYKSGMKIAGGMMKGQIEEKELPKYIGSASQAAKKAMIDDLNSSTDIIQFNDLRAAWYKDFSWTDGAASIVRQQYAYLPEGKEKRELPWIISIFDTSAYLTDMQMLSLAEKIQLSVLARLLKNQENQ